MLDLELDVQQIDPIFAEVSAQISPLARINGQHPPASQVLADIWKSGRLPLYRRSSLGQELTAKENCIEDVYTAATDFYRPYDDYTLIDPWLQLSSSLDESIYTSTELAVQYNLGYAGLTPSQRRDFVIWLTDLSQSAPLIYQKLYIAYLEVWLLEGHNQAEQAYGEMTRLHHFPAWKKQALLSQAFMLAQWLCQDGQKIEEWIISHRVPAQFLGILLGWQGLLGHPLSPEVLNYALASWQLATRPQDKKVVALHLNSLQESLNGDVLAYALAQLPDEAKTPKPWRCAHRDLRIALPQPDVRPILEPLLRDIFETSVEKTQNTTEANGLKKESEYHHAEENPSVDGMNWYLIVEFSDNRTAIFQEVLRTVKRIKTFTQIMDENRMMVYRVTYDEKNLSKFWHIWWRIYRWPSVQVYINGERVRIDDVYPRSSYFPG